jgi:hypothetical protein
MGVATVVAVFRSSLVEWWGSLPDERELSYPCDGLIDAPDRTLFRAVDVLAGSELVFRWLCQLRAAPYSYDWIDNLGRRSPRLLTPGLDELEVGQIFMTIFRLVGFEEGRSITVESRSRLFGLVAASYVALPSTADRSRLVVKLAFKAPRGLRRGATRLLLPSGDLIMMRKQLLTLKALTERSAAASSQ